MAPLLYTVFIVAIVAAFVNNCSAITEEQKAALKEKLKANAIECGTQHGVNLEQAAQWKQEQKSPDDTNKCFYGCMFRKSGLLNDQGLFDENTTLEKMKPYVSEARQDEVAAAVKACASVNDKPVGDGAAGCDRAVLLFNCLHEQKDLLVMALE